MLIPVLLFLLAQYWHSEAKVVNNNFKIWGGKDINITEAPYVVSVHRKGQFWCQGSLIAKDIVLTAAQCKYRRDKPAYFKVRVGSSVIDEGKVHRVSKYLIHPKYNTSTFTNDLGIIFLSTPVTLSDSVALIEMKNKGEEVDTGATAKLTGWGYTEDFDIPLQLQQVEVKAINSTECAKYIKDVKLTEQEMCAGVNGGGKGFCFGDGGAPLVHDNKLAGMASWMVGFCPQSDAPYEVYSKVASMRDWIDEVINNHTRHN